MKRIVLIALACLAAGLFWAERQGYLTLPLFGGAQQADGVRPTRGGGPRVEPPIPVLAVAAKIEDVPVTLDAVGTIQARSTVVVRAQVEGRLIELNFKDGQDVKQGDILARIDARTFQAAYDQAVAKKAQDQAVLANARVDLQRYIRLADSNVGTRQQADTQRSLVAQLEAQVQADQASIDNAKAILDYTTIRAPISGRTGIRGVDIGNVIRGSDASGIVTIAELRPIALIFSMPQQQLRALTQAIARGPVKVQALEADNKTIIEEGQVDVVDNLVDQTTGTIKVRASFGNADLRLWPGQFVNVRTFVDTLPEAIVIPAAAVQRGPNGAYVYVVTDNQVKLTNVTITRQDERIAAVEKGIEPPMRVVTSGFGRLTDGARVAATAPEAAEPPPEAASRADRTRRGPGGGGRAGGGRGPGAQGAPPAGAPAAGAAPTGGATQPAPPR